MLLVIKFDPSPEKCIVYSLFSSFALQCPVISYILFFSICKFIIVFYICSIYNNYILLYYILYSSSCPYSTLGGVGSTCTLITLFPISRHLHVYDFLTQVTIHTIHLFCLWPSSSLISFHIHIQHSFRHVAFFSSA